jgi:hypothetical protein
MGEFGHEKLPHLLEGEMLIVRANLLDVFIVYFSMSVLVFNYSQIINFYF